MNPNLEPQPTQPGGPNWGFLAALAAGAFFWAVFAYGLISILKLISNG